MKKIDKKYSNPRAVNDKGGMLISQEDGIDLYIDSDHPQYEEWSSGAIGEVKRQIIKDAGIYEQPISMSDAVETLKELIQKTGVSVKNKKFNKAEK